MTQNAILDILKNNKAKWYNAKQIAAILEVTTATKPLLKLRKTGMVLYKTKKKSGSNCYFEYRYKSDKQNTQ